MQEKIRENRRLEKKSDYLYFWLSEWDLVLIGWSNWSSTVYLKICLIKK